MRSFFGIILLVSLLMTGCVSTDAPTEISNGEPALPKTDADPDPVSSAKPETAAVSTACANEYYPISSTPKKYKFSGDADTSGQIVHKDVTDNGFVEERTLDSGLVVSTNWICTDEGLRTAEFDNMGQTKQLKFNVETVKSDGITIPKSMTADQEWDSEYDVKVNVKAGKIAISANGDVDITNKVVAVDEPIKIGDKEYRTVRTESEMGIIITIKGRTTEAGKFKVTRWFAKDIGLVKQESKSHLGSEKIELIE